VGGDRARESWAWLLSVSAATFIACGSPPPDHSGATNPPADRPITIALTGDTSFVHLDGASSDALRLVRDATFGFTNLEVNLLDDARARAAAARPAPRWIFAAASQARLLNQLGINIASLANNHAVDFGADGLASTRQALEAARIMVVGAGDDLAAAQAARGFGGSAGRIAFVAVTASASDQSRASPSQPDIQGRPGVSPLLFDAAITVDAATYRTLAGSVISLGAGPPPGDRTLTMFGRRITKGDQTRVDFTLNAAEEQRVLAAIRDARKIASVVMVSVHSHEPSNDSEEPASFFRQFAHDAIDAGAALVVGHGPHRLRGVELYEGVPIFYSLGNFIYQREGLDFRAADPFDAGSDLYTAAIGALAGPALPSTQLDRDGWWEGALVVATVNQGRLEGARLYPLNLKRTSEAPGGGLPELARGTHAGAILRQISALSERLGTALNLRDSNEFLDVPISKIR
jgi:poly-gamma-glutamate synthesis protein (capsule biosynthesis protein)